MFEKEAKNLGLKELRRKIESRSTTMGVIGLGYVGLPLAVEAAKGKE